VLIPSTIISFLELTRVMVLFVWSAILSPWGVLVKKPFSTIEKPTIFLSFKNLSSIKEILVPAGIELPGPKGFLKGKK
jgi:hypothetical protein